MDWPKGQYAQKVIRGKNMVIRLMNPKGYSKKPMRVKKVKRK